MTLEELETLIDDTKKLPRAADKVALAQALATLEVARQLMILNQSRGAGNGASKKAGAGKK